MVPKMKNVVGVTVALPQEAYALFGKLGWSRTAEFITRVERFQDILLLVVISGQGLARARKAAEYLLESNPLLILNLGVAGGLVENLSAGDLLIPDFLSDHDSTVELNNRVKRSLDRLLQSLGIDFQGGLLVTCNETVDSPAAKTALHHKTGAAAVDMEAFGIGSVCSGAGVPFYVVKAVTDSLSQSIPRAITSCVSETGRISFLRLTLNILSRPRLMPRLFEMQKSFNAAVYSLEQVKSLLMANLSRSLLSSFPAGDSDGFGN